MTVSALLFSAAGLASFGLFILLHPLDWQQPETLRMHYHSLQTGIRDGPLSSAWSRADLLRPLSCLARGGTYEARYPVKLVDMQAVKLLRRLVDLTGPFLDEPLNILFILITAAVLASTASRCLACPPAGLAAAGFWLATTQTLLDSRYPVRPNMAIAGCLVSLLVRQIVVLRRAPPAPGRAFAVALLLFASFTVHEYALGLLPALAVALVWERRALRANRKALLWAGLAALLAYIFYYRAAVPRLMKLLIQEEIPWVELQNASPLALRSPVVLFQRLRDFTLHGLAEFVRLNGGLNTLLPRGQRIAGLIAAALVAAAAAPRGWKAAGYPLMVCLAYFIPVSLVMYPLIPSAVEMPVYYYALFGVLAVFLPAALLASASRSPRPWRWRATLGGLAVIAGLNLHTADLIMKALPADFGFTTPMRRYVRDVLDLQRRGQAGEYPLPAYLAYPRPSRFDISVKWDIMLRVWHGESEHVFALLVPAIYLRDFERRSFLGNPAEFAVSAGLPEAEYEASAASFVDLPARKWHDLRPLRSSAGLTAATLRWRSEDGREILGNPDDGILGRAVRSLLSPGRWETRVAVPPGITDRSRAVFLVRADLQAAGAEDVYHRTQPLPPRSCRIEATTGAGLRVFSPEYGWSYELHAIPLGQPGSGTDIRLRVETEGWFEMVGPIVVPSDAVAGVPWSPGS